MPDFFDNQANFTNPQYASPEQLAAQRSYADALLKQSGQAVNRPTGALANLINALHGGWERNNADKIQNEAAARNSQDVSEVIAQLKNRDPQTGGPQNINPDTLGRIYANPMASPEHRALAGALIGQTPYHDSANRPGFISPIGGTQAASVSPQLQPGLTPAVSAGNSSISAVPMAAPALGQRPPVASSPTVWGDHEAEKAGLYPTPQPGGGGQAPQAALPAAGTPAGLPPQATAVIGQLGAIDRNLSAQKAFTQGGAEAITNVQKSDIAAATDAPVIKRVAGVMLNDLQTHGDKMTFGPTAQWSNDIKRGLANYAPSFFSKQELDSLASADSFDKMSAQLTSILAKGGGTDAQLFNNMKSVPGSHNSKEGAEALLKMTIQVADQQQALRQITAAAKTPQEYEAMRNDFYKRNPIINPITGNPIQMDVEAARRMGTNKQSSGPEPGVISNGYRFKGGNYKDKSNWEPVT